MNVERCGEFAVAEVVAAKKKQFCLARWQRREDTADAFLLFGGGVDLFGRGVEAHDGEDVFVASAARLSAQFVEAEADGGAIEPGLGLRCVGTRSTPEANERLDGEFFGPSGVADDASDDSRDAVESSAEDRLDVDGRFGRGRGFEDDVAGCVHTHITTQAGDL